MCNFISLLDCTENILTRPSWAQFAPLPGFGGPLLDKSRKADQSLHSIKLKDGSAYLRSTFNENILFKIAKESDEVFSSLILLRFTASFNSDYDAFLINLQCPDWYEPYRDEEFAKRQSYFAIYAYLSGDINREELLVINAVAGAYTEIRESFREEVKITVVESSEICSVLTLGNFPPYSPITMENILTKRKPDCETSKTLEKEWGLRSYVLKTIIEYPLDEDLLSSDGDTYTKIGIRVGFNEGKVILLPPEFTISLVAETSSCDVPDPKDHWFSFGYNPSAGEAFYRGLRVISIPSLLFPITIRPHGAKKGPPALALLAHDINYHIFLEGNIPKNHREIMIELSREFNIYRSFNHLIKKEQTLEMKKLSQQLARHLADREFLHYRGMPNDQMAFWSSLDAWIDFTMNQNERTHEFEIKPHADEWRRTILIPVLVNVLRKYQADEIFDKKGESSLESSTYTSVRMSLTAESIHAPSSRAIDFSEFEVVEDPL